MSAFSTLWTVICKELRDILRDRRTLVLSLLLTPLLYPLIILGMGMLSESRVKTQVDQLLEVPTIGREYAPTLINFLAAKRLNAVAPSSDVVTAIHTQQIDVALRIDSGYADAWREGRPALVEIVYDATRRDAEIPVARLKDALNAYSQQVGMLRLLARGIDPQVVRPIEISTWDLATPDAKRALLMSVILPMLLVITSFIGGASLVLDATAGERERQSLEPLLTTPVSRHIIVSGKIVAACAVGLLSLLLTLLAFKLSAQLASAEMSQQLNVGFIPMLQMLFILLPVLFMGTALLTFLAAAAKSVKEAQSHMAWLLLLPVLPSYAMMAYPLKSQLWQFAIPFLAQNQLLQKVIRNEVVGIEVWAIYLSMSFGLALLLWWAAVRRYCKEQLAVSD
ncbi:ABC transporter permease [Xylella fastidiosa subsp. morus]|uniref:ABC transporter permease n=1 Tax=Xylella fastidiosa TaxID=2371 RepID=UPI0003ED02C1|nr:ABC transporter permease [Xylella fastidiosa]AIC12632.1 sodium ABC transporter permease [Xylella fastidiosa MUL0034]EWG15290.1 ABC transporter sodium permease [Xylella fastidiosa Mul-MD]UIN28732.1 ABC transporter permease [Xylella fastidiosa subsp. morus]UIT37473.1 ABC transporter permease [Xylella fastidiosa subsp. morus]UIT39767.1 ABC transporter permease [Xylella fastidiosa subsp. morus]